MTVRGIQGVMAWPSVWPGAASPAFTSLQINADRERVEFVFETPKDGILDGVGFKLGTVTQITNGLRVSFQEVDPATGDSRDECGEYIIITEGLITGRWVETNCTGKMTCTGAAGGTQRTVTMGCLIACVIEPADFETNDDLNIDLISNTPTVVAPPYAGLFTASWAKNSSALPFTVRYSDGAYEYLGENVWPVSAFCTSSISASTSPDEVGNVFRVPFPMRVVGWWGMINSGAAARNFHVVLYDTDCSTALGTSQVDTDMLRFPNQHHTIQRRFPAPISLTTLNADYRLVVKGQSGAVILQGANVSNPPHMNAFWGGCTMYSTSRTDADVWEHDQCVRYIMGLLIDGGDDATSSGGGGGGGDEGARIGSPLVRRMT